MSKGTPVVAESSKLTGRPVGSVDEGAVQRMLETTVQLVAAHGYEGASTKEIARVAGVSKGLLHYHFESKEELLLQALSYLAEQIAADIQGRANRPGPALERLLAAANDLYELLLSNRTRTAFLTEIYATSIHSERLRARLGSYRRRERDLVEESLAAAIGEFSDQFVLPMDRLASMIQTLMLGVSVQSAVIPDDVELARRWEDILQFIITGMLVPISGSAMPHATGREIP